MSKYLFIALLVPLYLFAGFSLLISTKSSKSPVITPSNIGTTVSAACTPEQLLNAKIKVRAWKHELGMIPVITDDKCIPTSLKETMAKYIQFQKIQGELLKKYNGPNDFDIRAKELEKIDPEFAYINRKFPLIITKIQNDIDGFLLDYQIGITSVSTSEPVSTASPMARITPTAIQTQPEKKTVTISNENSEIKATLISYWSDNLALYASVTVTNKGMDRSATLSELCNQGFLTDGTHNISTGIGLVSGQNPVANKGETVSYTLRVPIQEGYKVTAVGCGPDSSVRLNVP
jgi:hypothetical protein